MPLPVPAGKGFTAPLEILDIEELWLDSYGRLYGWWEAAEMRAMLRAFEPFVSVYPPGSWEEAADARNVPAAMRRNTLLPHGDLALRAQRWALFSAWWGQYRGPVVKAWTEDARRKAPQSGGNAERA